MTSLVGYHYSNLGGNVRDTAPTFISIRWPQQVCVPLQAVQEALQHGVSRALRAAPAEVSNLR